MATTEESLEPLKTIIAEVLGQNEGDITADTKIADIIGGKQTKLIIGINEKFGTSLSENDMADFTTVGDLVALLDKNGS